jgi:hypothetical protein
MSRNIDKSKELPGRERRMKDKRCKEGIPPTSTFNTYLQ